MQRRNEEQKIKALKDELSDIRAGLAEDAGDSPSASVRTLLAKMDKLIHLNEKGLTVEEFGNRLEDLRGLLEQRMRQGADVSSSKYLSATLKQVSGDLQQLQQKAPATPDPDPVAERRRESELYRKHSSDATRSSISSPSMSMSTGSESPRTASVSRRSSSSASEEENKRDRQVVALEEFIDRVEAYKQAFFSETTKKNFELTQKINQGIDKAIGALVAKDTAKGFAVLEATLKEVPRSWVPKADAYQGAKMLLGEMGYKSQVSDKMQREIELKIRLEEPGAQLAVKKRIEQQALKQAQPEEPRSPTPTRSSRGSR